MPTESPRADRPLRPGSSAFERGLVVAFAILLALWRCWDALLEPERTLARGGPGWDGIATIGDMYEWGERVARAPLANLTGCCTRSHDVAAGLNAGMCPTLPWALLQALFLPWTAPENLYDVLMAVVIALNTCAAYVLGRVLARSRLVAVLVSLGLASFEVVDARAMEHLGLAPTFAAMLLCAQAVRSGREPSQGRMLWLAVAMWLNIAISEYYGFYGIVFAIILFVGHLPSGSWTAVRQGRVRFRWVIASAAVGVALLLVTYPRFVVQPLMERAGLLERREEIGMRAIPSRAATDYEFYALTHPGGVFRPGIEALRRVVPAFIDVDGWRPEMQAVETDELTYHAGTVGPLLALVLAVLAALRWRRARRVPIEPQQRAALDAALRGSVAFVLGAVVMTLFALPPSAPLSLATWIVRVGLPFRVGIRALLYLDIAVWAVIGLMGGVLWDAWKPRQAGTRWAVGAAVATLTVLAQLDARPGRAGIWAPLSTFALPWSRPALEPLRERPDGLLVELPFLDARTDLYNLEYKYRLDQVIHRKPILNGMGDPVLRGVQLGLATLLNTPSADTLVAIRHLGIRYLLLRDEPGRDWSFYRQAPAFRAVGPSAVEVIEPTELAPDERQARIARPRLLPAGLLPTTVPGTVLVSGPFDPSLLARSWTGSTAEPRALVVLPSSVTFAAGHHTLAATGAIVARETGAWVAALQARGADGRLLGTALSRADEWAGVNVARRIEVTFELSEPAAVGVSLFVQGDGSFVMESVSWWSGKDVVVQGVHTQRAR